MLKGKKILITGLMSDRSIAYGISEAMHREGAELIFTYVGEKFKDRVVRLTEPFHPKAILACDVGNDAEIATVFDEIEKIWGALDGIVHSIAYAPADQLEGDFIGNVTREGFNIAHDISSYSLCALAKAGRALMKDRNAAIVALTYLGAERAMPNYNTMGLAKASLEAAIRFTAYSLGPEGVRVNGISAGPIRTLAASGIKGFRAMLDYNAKVSPLKRNVTTEEVGNVAAFLCSDLASAITGEIVHADCGYSMVGIPPLE